jgi:hypothetical protein
MLDQRGCPFSDEHRRRLRDDWLWNRELQRARLLNSKCIHCPCTKYKGQRKWLIRTVRDHLIKNGRDPGFRIWRGPGVSFGTLIGSCRRGSYQLMSPCYVTMLVDRIPAVALLSDSPFT